MSDTVKVDGVLLTREQIERAHRELDGAANQTELDNARALHLKSVRLRSMVRLRSVGSKRQGIVLSTGSVLEHYKRGFNQGAAYHRLKGVLTVVDDNGSGYTYSTLKNFYKTWELV